MLSNECRPPLPLVAQTFLAIRVVFVPGVQLAYFVVIDTFFKVWAAAGVGLMFCFAPLIAFGKDKETQIRSQRSLSSFVPNFLHNLYNSFLASLPIGDSNKLFS